MEGITDGTSNTLMVGEFRFDLEGHHQASDDGLIIMWDLIDSWAFEGVTDGTSNTVVFGGEYVRADAGTPADRHGDDLVGWDFYGTDNSPFGDGSVRHISSGIDDHSWLLL